MQYDVLEVMVSLLKVFGPLGMVYYLFVRGLELDAILIVLMLFM